MPGKLIEGPRGWGKAKKRATARRIKGYETMVGAKAHKEDILTNLVCKQAEKLPVWEKEYFNIYRLAETVEHMDNGIPFVVIDDLKVQIKGGFALEKLSRPVILVGSNLTLSERKAMASFLYSVWAVLRSKGRGAMKEAMTRAAKSMNPRILESILAKRENRRIRAISELKKRYLEVWRKNAANKKAFKRGYQDVISGRRDRAVFTIDKRTFVVQYNKSKRVIDIYMSPSIQTIQYFDLKAGYVPGSNFHLGAFSIKSS